MSMISAQIDELREYADRADGTFPLLASALRDAADTIWQLRDDLQRANAEYAKLRDEFDKMDKWHSAELIAEMDENAKLRELCEQCAIELYVNGNVTDASTEMLFDDMRELGIEVGRVSWKAHEAAERIADGWYSELEYTRKRNAVLGRENAKLREQMERLVTLLRVDCDIDASWDGLRRFWSIGLTENGCLMRDRACKAEAENVKLREQIYWLKKGDILHVLTDQEYIDQCELERLMQVSIDALDAENAKLRELAKDMGELLDVLSDCDMVCEHYHDGCIGDCYYVNARRELGIEVGDG